MVPGPRLGPSGHVSITAGHQHPTSHPHVSTAASFPPNTLKLFMLKKRSRASHLFKKASNLSQGELDHHSLDQIIPHGSIRVHSPTCTFRDTTGPTAHQQTPVSCSAGAAGKKQYWEIMRKSTQNIDQFQCSKYLIKEILPKMCTLLTKVITTATHVHFCCSDVRKPEPSVYLLQELFLQQINGQKLYFY